MYPSSMTFDELMKERDRVMSEATLDMLITSLIFIMAEWRDEDMPNEVRLIHSWTCEEIEKRVPEITPIIAKSIDNDDVIRYGQRIVLAVGKVLGI